LWHRVDGGSVVGSVEGGVKDGGWGSPRQQYIYI
jgi:hypothetical protein